MRIAVPSYGDRVLPRFGLARLFWVMELNTEFQPITTRAPKPWNPLVPALPIRSRSLAAVFIVAVLHHVVRQQETLREVLRWLRPGGVLAIVEFEHRHVTTKFFGMFPRMSGRRCRFLTSDELTSMLRGLGLRVAATRLDGPRYGVSARL